MPHRLQPPTVQLTGKQKALLEQIVRRQTNPQHLVRRARIILTIARGTNNSRAGARLELDRETIRIWRERWSEAAPYLLAAETADMSDKELLACLEIVLADAARPGAPATFTPEQIVQIVALACEDPQESGRSITHWTRRELADEAIKRGIVEDISPRSVGRFLDEAVIKPHLSRHWLNPDRDDPETFDAEVKTVCDVYQEAPALHQKGVGIVSTDEKTGIQALERKHPTLPVRPGLIERQEFEYIRNGTLCLIANFQVATGKIIAPTLGPTRTEADFASHVEQTIATNPEGEWIFVVDQLNTHMSESPVKLVAGMCGIDEASLGKKEKQGILKSMATRKAFLEDCSHRIRFVYTPKHTSWLNQVEIWFSILVRKLIRRASFSSVEDLRQRILDFITYFNETMAKPFKWTFSGRPLTV